MITGRPSTVTPITIPEDLSEDIRMLIDKLILECVILKDIILEEEVEHTCRDELFTNDKFLTELQLRHRFTKFGKWEDNTEEQKEYIMKLNGLIV